MDSLSRIEKYEEMAEIIPELPEQS